MTKTKDFGEPLANDYYRRGYAAGLKGGEKRLARALARFILRSHRTVKISDITDFVTARLKEKSK